jgi:hypothetical protein
MKTYMFRHIKMNKYGVFNAKDEKDAHNYLTEWIGSLVLFFEIDCPESDDEIWAIDNSETAWRQWFDGSEVLIT